MENEVGLPFTINLKLSCFDIIYAEVLQRGHGWWKWVWVCGYIQTFDWWCSRSCMCPL